MTLQEYISTLPWGEKVTLRYSINGKERTFGTYVTTPEQNIHPIDSERIIHDFDDLRIKEVSVVDERIIIRLAVGTTFISKHPKYKHGRKLPTPKSLEELI